MRGSREFGVEYHMSSDIDMHSILSIVHMVSQIFNDFINFI